jgi:ubiquinone/menaquinone biosynthesis C-methylase UbiE
MNKAEFIQRATITFNAAADCYDNPVLSYWNRFGKRTIDQIELQSGARVLDVCCGSGASAIPAAVKVGATGTVLGVDLAESLLELARQKSQRQGLKNIEFHCSDFSSLGLKNESFDAVVCVFGIFFLPDMEASVNELWRMLRPGGKLAITSWGARMFEPATTKFWSTIESERPDLYRKTPPWDRISNPLSLQTLLESGGANNVKVFAEVDSHKLSIPEDWWVMAMGGGLRSPLDKLDSAARERIRSTNLEFLRVNSIDSLDSDVLYAIAQK